jgi:hypothetical protein
MRSRIAIGSISSRVHTIEVARRRPRCCRASSRDCAKRRGPDGIRSPTPSGTAGQPTSGRGEVNGARSGCCSVTPAADTSAQKRATFAAARRLLFGWYSWTTKRAFARAATRVPVVWDVNARRPAQRQHRLHPCARGRSVPATKTAGAVETGRIERRRGVPTTCEVWRGR